MMLNYIQPIDVALRLSRVHPNWYHGIPDIILTGETGKFGDLKFDFQDSIIEYRIFIRDREKILDAAHLAVINFDKYLELL